MKLLLMWLLSVAAVTGYKVQLQGIEQDLGQRVPKFPRFSLKFQQGQLVNESQLDNLPHMDLSFRQVAPVVNC